MILSKPEGVPETLWSRLLDHATPRTAEAGELLWEPGETRDAATFLLVHGLARLYHPSRKGNAITLLMLGPGSLLGHHHELEQRPYATGAEALCTTQLLALPAGKVSAWLAGKDSFSHSFTDWARENLRQHLDETYLRLELEHDSARAKVAHILLVLDQHALLDHMSRQHIADLANVTLETTVRTISALLHDGVLSSAHFTRLSESERLALADVLEPFEGARPD